MAVHLGLHVVAKSEGPRWSALLAEDKALIASQYPAPAGLDPGARWVQNISPSWYASGADMAQAILGGLGDRSEPRRAIMVDELRGNTHDKVHKCAIHLRDRQGVEHMGRWGVYLVTGSSVRYVNFNAPPKATIDVLLEAGAILAPEFYYHTSWYENAYLAASGSPAMRTVAADRDVAGFIAGGSSGYPPGRLAWLNARRAHKGSSSPIMPLLGVTDKYARTAGIAPALSLDRQMYAAVTRTGLPGVFAAEGFGSWVWDERVGSSSLDDAFVVSLEHYVIAGRTSSLRGRIMP